MSSEFKKIVCDPDDETGIINHYTKFGWKVNHRDEVFSQSSSVISSKSAGIVFGGGIGVGHTQYNTATSTVNYVNLLFERDYALAHYQEIANYDQQCENLAAQIDSLKKTQKAKASRVEDQTGKGFRIVSFVIMLSGIVLFATGCGAAMNNDLYRTGGPTATWVVGLILTILGLILVMVAYFNNRGKKASQNVMSEQSFLNRVAEVRRQVGELEKKSLLLLNERTPAIIEEAPAISPEKKPLVIEASSEEVTPEKSEPKKESAESSFEPSSDGVKQLYQLKQLHDEGLLTDEEYEKKRKDVVSKL
jgi:uncharacterized membrane protein